MRLRPISALACAAALVAVAAAHADSKSDALLAKARESLKKAKSLTGDLQININSDGEKQELTGTVQLLKPNLGKLTLKTPEGSQSFQSTGKEVYITLDSQKQYLKQPADEKGGMIGSAAGPIGAAFFNPDSLGAGGETKHLGTQKVGAKSYEVVQVSGAGGQTQKLFFTAAGVPEGAEMTFGNGEQKLTQRIWIKNLKLDAPLTAQQFAFKVPAGFEEFKQPDFEDSLLKVGSKAPSFQLPTPDGQQLSLEQALQGKKAVVINFWFYG
ncbi:MAG: hypothetical protein ACK47B_12045 [Armatimonadota bacterium]